MRIGSNALPPFRQRAYDKERRSSGSFTEAASSRLRARGMCPFRPAGCGPESSSRTLNTPATPHLVPKVRAALWEPFPAGKILFPTARCSEPQGEPASSVSRTQRETEFPAGAPFPKRSANFGNERYERPLETRRRSRKCFPKLMRTRRSAHSRLSVTLCIICKTPPRPDGENAQSFPRCRRSLPHTPTFLPETPLRYSTLSETHVHNLQNSPGRRWRNHAFLPENCRAPPIRAQAGDERTFFPATPLVMFEISTLRKSCIPSRNSLQPRGADARWRASSLWLHCIIPEIPDAAKTLLFLPKTPVRLAWREDGPGVGRAISLCGRLPIIPEIRRSVRENVAFRPEIRRPKNVQSFPKVQSAALGACVELASNADLPL